MAFTPPPPTKLLVFVMQISLILDDDNILNSKMLCRFWFAPSLFPYILFGVAMFCCSGNVLD